MAQLERGLPSLPDNRPLPDCELEPGLMIAEPSAVRASPEIPLRLECAITAEIDVSLIAPGVAPLTALLPPCLKYLTRIPENFCFHIAASGGA